MLNHAGNINTLVDSIENVLNHTTNSIIILISMQPIFTCNHCEYVELFRQYVIHLINMLDFTYTECQFERKR